MKKFIYIILIFALLYSCSSQWCAVFQYYDYKKIIEISKPEMEMSSEGINKLIKPHEGLALNFYIGPDGNRYIGYGHQTKTLTIITKNEAEQLLLQDIARIEKKVNKVIKIYINQYQFDALCSFAYTFGSLPKSVAKAVNSGGDVPALIKKYNKTHKNGKLIVLRGLTKRRLAEARWYQQNEFTYNLIY